LSSWPALIPRVFLLPVWRSPSQPARHLPQCVCQTHSRLSPSLAIRHRGEHNGG